VLDLLSRERKGTVKSTIAKRVLRRGIFPGIGNWRLLFVHISTNKVDVYTFIHVGGTHGFHWEKPLQMDKDKLSDPKGSFCTNDVTSPLEFIDGKSLLMNLTEKVKA
jgi:hypothetical protein